MYRFGMPNATKEWPEISMDDSGKTDSSDSSDLPTSIDMIDYLKSGHSVYMCICLLGHCIAKLGKFKIASFEKINEQKTEKRNANK